VLEKRIMEQAETLQYQDLEFADLNRRIRLEEERLYRSDSAHLDGSEGSDGEELYHNEVLCAL
jgi:hypothetical protein